MEERSAGALQDATSAAIDYVYIRHKPFNFNHVELRKMKQVLMEQGYLCKNVNPEGIVDRDFMPFVYLNLKFVKENEEFLGESHGETRRLIEFDCAVNQIIEDGYDSLKARVYPTTLPEPFLKLLRSIPKTNLLEYYRAQSELKEGRVDLADIFGMIKTELLAEYYMNSFIEISINEPLDVGVECYLLAGNGLTMSIVEGGSSKYGNEAILQRAYNVRLSRVKVSGKEMKSDFEKIVKDVNSIVASEDRATLEGRLKRGIVHYFGELVDRLDNRYIDQANRILLLKCENRFYRNQISDVLGGYEFEASDFSFEEMLYLFEAFGLSVSSGDNDERLDRYVRATQRIPYYRRILGLAIFNDGQSVKKDGIIAAKRMGRFLSSVKIGLCLTTNYDAFCEHFLQCPVTHLHGSFLHYRDQDGEVRVHAIGDYEAIVENVQSSEELVISLGLPKDAEKFAAELDQLTSIRGTLIVFGFSGDYDNHISSRISENSGIDRLVFFRHDLKRQMKEGRERLIKMDVLWKFSRMRKSIVIVDSERLFE